MSSGSNIKALPQEAPKPSRVIAIDALRGLVMVLMASELLGNPHWLTEAFPDSRICAWIAYHAVHVAWRGCALHDLIQPTFSLLVGVSCAYSIASRQAKGHTGRAILLHAAWRAALLVALGVWVRSLGAPRPFWTFEDTLAQIGLGYVPLVALALSLRLRGVLAVAAGVMLGYWLLFACWPPPDGTQGFAAHWTPACNPARAFDHWFLQLFPGNETYYGNGYGVLNFIPTLGTMLIGLAAGLWLRSNGNAGARIPMTLVPVGLALLAGGWVLDVSGICPLIKRIWTLSFALWSGGLALTALGALHWLADGLGWRRWLFPLVVVGMNSIAAYLLVDIQHAAPFVRTALAPVVTPAREMLGRTLECRVQAENDGPLVILKATYGVRGDPAAGIDVTEAVAKASGGHSIRLEVSNEALGCDPAPGKDKVLTVRYGVAGREREASAAEYATLNLPYASPAAAVFAKHLPPLFAAACELAAIWLILLWMHRRRIYLKI